MLTASLRRKTCLFFVMLLSASWAVSSAPVPWAERPPVVEGAEVSALEVLHRAWSLVRSTVVKVGCHIDPNGKCAPAPIIPSSQNKAGCHIDPDGRCL
jgi:hypothetical protein